MSEDEVRQSKQCVVNYIDKDGNPASREGDHKMVWDRAHQTCR